MELRVEGLEDLKGRLPLELSVLDVNRICAVQAAIGTIDIEIAFAEVCEVTA